jgi:RNA polymerase sigma-70 factor (ECF subfamily)
MDGAEPAVDEAALVAGLHAGEESSFRDLVLRYHAAIVRLVRLGVASPAAAEEVATNTWRQVIRDIGDFDGRSSLKVWIFGIALNQARGCGAGQRRTALSPDPDGARATPAVDPDRFTPEGQRWAGHWCAPPVPWTGSPAQRLIGEAAVAAVVNAIEELPPGPREVVALRDVEGWKTAEVCALLGISEPEQGALLHRGRSRVRARLEDHLGGR